MTALMIIGLVTAIGAAVRGNWSPCGESLQAQIHPLGEHSRGNVWGITVGAFTFGSIIAGATLTGAMGALGGAIASGLDTSAVVLAAGVLALAAGVLDLSPLTPWTPRRQVNENWIGRYRGWVYGTGFGIQLGLGFAVFVMSWGYYAMLGIALLTASPLAGASLGAAFGLGRGILLYLSRWITSPERLAVFHQRMAALKAPVFRATALVTVAAGSLAFL